MPAEITQLISYPIKSCAGISHNEITVNEMGLYGDRQWMLVDQDGLFLSQRKHPKMAMIQPQLSPSTLTLSAPGMNPLSVNLTTASHNMNVTVWKDTFQASVISIAADRWFSEYLGIEIHLVHYDEVSHRQIDLDFAKPDQTVAFADGFPVLVVHQASLDQLNENLDRPVEMSRFRPNIVVKTTTKAWSELNWSHLTLNTIKLNLVKPCSRCVITGVEQQSGIQTGTEVLKTLKQKFAYQGNAIFGINAIPEISSKNQTHQSSTALKVGMRLKVTQKPNTE